MPIIAEFSAQHGFGKDIMYDWPEFSNLLRVCVAKKEAYLEREGVHDHLNPSVTNFALKQLGWRDKHEIESNSTETIHYVTSKPNKPDDAGTG
jgi:hypothetical protein